MTHEKALMEFRQVKRPITQRVHHDLGSYEQATGCYYTTQQKWQVEDTSRTQYAPAFNGRPDQLCDEFIGMIDGRAMWQPMKLVWRDLPVVSEEEAKQDSQ